MSEPCFGVSHAFAWIEGKEKKKNQIHKITSLTHLNLEKKIITVFSKNEKNKYFQLTFMTSFFQSFGGNSSLILEYTVPPKSLREEIIFCSKKRKCTLLRHFKSTAITRLKKKMTFGTYVINAMDFEKKWKQKKPARYKIGELKFIKCFYLKSKKNQAPNKNNMIIIILCYIVRLIMS